MRDFIKSWVIPINPVNGRVRRERREGSEGQSNKEEERKGGSGTGKGPMARERITWIFVLGPASP